MQKKYTREMLVWLAREIEQRLVGGKVDRKRLIADFTKTFHKKLSPGKLAGIYANNGGDQAEFVRTHKNLALDPSEKPKSKNVVKAAPAPPALPAPEEFVAEEEEALEDAFAKLQRLAKKPDVIYSKRTELDSERNIELKRAAAENLIAAALRGEAIQDFKIRSPRGAGGSAEFLEYLGYTPQFAKLVERVLGKERPSTL